MTPMTQTTLNAARHLKSLGDASYSAYVHLARDMHHEALRTLKRPRRVRTDYCAATDSLVIERRDTLGRESVEVRPAYVTGLKLAVERGTEHAPRGKVQA